MEKLLKLFKSHRAALAALGLLLVVTNPELRALIMLADAVGAGLILLTMSGYLKLAWHTVVARAPDAARSSWRVATRGVQGLAMSRNVSTMGMHAMTQCRCLLALRRPG
ncbi:hypothetical protein [Mitsuaria sp. 7]|uniref:hypothetical protein n=1 Tax=Mitsuaria sp. 7 TaxID=1658665 RepID=UPI0007DD6C78|nr:hypothetical protein [Mitsuaria sp. 7]ANH69155.1 hypothetical protein ABE85_19155 [Mitsuaria sp. 7]